MALPNIVSRDEWLVARKALLLEEKELTRARDALNTERRNLPMVKVDKPYVFEGPTGKAGLLDMFEGRLQIFMTHFMFAPEWDAGCPGCTADADEMSDGLRKHLAIRDTTVVYVSRAPYEKIKAYKEKNGWTVPWYSSFGSDFNYDYHTTLDDSVTPAMDNYKPFPGQKGEASAQSVFLRDGDDVYHTYSTFARGTEAIGGAYYYLDLTALGRQEDWEEPKGRANFARPANPFFTE